MQLDTIARLFDDCLRDAGVFRRDVEGGSLFETERVRSLGREWVAIGAGIAPAEAEECFRGKPSRADRSQTPLGIIGGGEARIFLMVRPVQPPFETEGDLDLVTDFAPGDDVPFVQLRQGGYIRIAEIPSNDANLNSFRWELDNRYAYSDPLEPWLRRWKRTIGFNPAHATSHLHMNAPPMFDLGERPVHPTFELRISAGIPNPLALLLSMAAWLRTNRT